MGVPLWRYESQLARVHPFFAYCLFFMKSRLVPAILIIFVWTGSFGQATERFIEVTGFGEVSAAPTKAVLSVDLREMTKDGKTISLSDFEGRLRGVVSSMKIPEGNLKAVTPAQARPMDRLARNNAAAEKRYTIEVGNVSVLDRLIESLRQADIVMVRVTETGSTEISKFMAEAQVSALNNAREKATALASASGNKLGRIIQIREVASGGNPAGMRRPALVYTGPTDGSMTDNLEPIQVTYEVVVRFLIE